MLLATGKSIAFDGDLLETPIRKQQPQEATLAAAEIEHAARAALFERRDHAPEPLLVQAQPPLDCGLFERVSVTRRSRPLGWPAKAGSDRKPTTNWYGPTVRRSCAAALPEKAGRRNPR